ncbi:MAG: asparagine synthase (glutamine-hydrolyzing) [Rhodoferax sp.]|nr:asparagine synthase (glutamine-hydrolyzing) [Rhodoferax sp.]
MCGLFMILERRRPVDAERAPAATEALRHRGPDGIGAYQFVWQDRAQPHTPAVSGYAGHTRLSIQDPARRSDQPFRRADKTLIYNGEVYNFRALRQELSATGSHFETESDTEVLLELVVRRGIDGLNQAHGMWAFCLLDEASGRMVAVRDRYGKKPLFFYQDADSLCLASEMAPILAYRQQRPVMKAAQLDTFLLDGWLFPHADGQTHIEGIRQVPAGCALHVDLASWEVRAERYFDLALYAGATNPEPEQLADLLQEAVLSRLVSDRKVGLLLSGGVDSSLILSVLCANGLADQVHCFTGDAGKSDDAFYARQCVKQLGIQAINVPLDYGSGGMAGFLEVCRHQEKPFPFIGNVLAMPQLYARIAEHDVPVVLDGTGGDEFFGGYWDRYYRFALAEARARGDSDWIAESLEANAGNAKAMVGARDEPDAARHRGRHLIGSLDDPPGLDAYLDQSVLLAPVNDPLKHWDGTLGAALVRDAAIGRLPEWLWQNDRNAMMSGIENRSPLLDHRFAPFMHSGAQAKFSGPWNKFELRNLFARFEPLPTQWRRDKQGFRWVYNRFLRSNRDAVLELVAGSRILPDRLDVSRLLQRARHDDATLESSLLQRCLCVAGLEQATGLVAAAAG